MKLTGLFFGIIAGHFLYQAFGPHEYGVAFERSYFSSLTLLGVWLVNNFPNFRSQRLPQATVESDNG